ncbi:MAG: two-component regulator propeller domain-containing protein [Paludibacter sp.]
MKKFHLILLLIIGPFLAHSQVQIQFSHFSVDDGLSENNVMSMFQDKKGFMWFGTYDGLNKYDGYTFRNFKGTKNHDFSLVNYRVDKIKEDRDGYLWILTYDGRIYRFNPSKEVFLAVPQCLEEYKGYKSPLKEITIMPDGSVWLWNNEWGNEDCFRVENERNQTRIRLSRFSKANGDLASNKISRISQDSRQNTWILSDKGISLLKRNTVRPVQLFKNNEGYGMFSLVETGSKIYIGGELGKIMVFDEKKETFEQLKSPFQANIIDLKILNNNELFILYNQKAFCIYNLKQQSFQEYKLAGLNVSDIYGAYQDKNLNIWLDTKFQGAIVFKAATRKIEYLPTPPTDAYTTFITPTFRVIEDKFDNLWIVTKTGSFYWYNRYANRLEYFYNNPTSKERKFSNLIHTALLDREGNLWLSTFSQGIDKVGFRHSQFSFTRPFDLPVYSVRNEVRSVFKDSKNWLWVGSRKGYVYLYDDKNQFRGVLGFDGKINGTKPLNIPVYTITEDHTGTIWLGSKGMGLFRVTRNSASSFNVSNYQYNADNIYSLASNAVYSVFEDHLKRIWVATFGGGINLIDNSTGTIQFISRRNKLKNYPLEDCNKSRYITEDRHGYLYVGTTGGLVVFRADKKAPEEIDFQRYGHNPNGTSYLSGNDVQYILSTRRGDLYLALFGGGLNVLRGGYRADKQPIFDAFEKTNGLFSNVIYTLKEDATGQVWMTTQTKIIRFNPQTSKFENYKPINANSYFFVEAAACQTREGELIYGTSDGFVSFNPLKITKNMYVPRICLTQLQVFNKPVVIGEEDSPLQQSIDDTKKLILSHKQNIFSIEFAALNYVNPQAIQYAYKLEGFENDWNYVGTQHIATYTNLPKGKYVFHVKSTNSDGEWVENEKTIEIVKEPSFWESAWGLLFYAVLFVLLLGLTSYILFTIYKLRSEVSIEQRITNMKLRFFTDISHELRTPLTLIASPIESLLRKEPLSAQATEQLLIVQRNTSRMLRLINQILDFRKVQNKKMNLIIEQVDVAEFVTEICENFSKLAEEKQMNLKITDQTNNAQLWIDKDKFEKILYNLLSNAFKFSQAQNTVEVIFAEDAGHIFISIKDQGIGISKDKLKLLFERFESFASSSGMTFQASTGIGLSLTKELVELHHASVEVESEPGKGSAFKLTFLKGFEHYSQKDNFVLKDLDPNIVSVPKPEIPEIYAGSEQGIFPGSIEMPKILIAEDNRELRQFLKSTLSANYDVFEAENGIQALDIALKYTPDIIVSDIMMPDMNGLELAKRIKGDMNISHIPLILLTAKTDMGSKLEALEHGVDDYITKPFSSTYLEARIENLLKLRRQLQHYFRTSLTTGVIPLSKPNVTSQDDIFIAKTIKFIEDNYMNVDMNIDDIAANSGLSRSSFFKKLKNLTGMAPVDFIREFRVQRAMQLLDGGETNISQIAYLVGMNDPRYFSKCFKQKYGINPSEYKQKRNSVQQ